MLGLAMLTLVFYSCSHDGEELSPNLVSPPTPVTPSPQYFKTVSSGNMHTLGIKTDGTLWAWGRNDFGQLGIGVKDASGSPDHEPEQIGSDSDWKMVSTGVYHSLAIKNDGSLWAWGMDTYGELGVGVNTENYAPVQVGTDTDWETVDCGVHHTVAIKTDHSLWGWGTSMHLGQGLNFSIGNYITDHPILLSMTSDWEKLSAGNDYTLALKTDQSLWGWGNNAHSVLGHIGTSTNDYDYFIGPLSDGSWKEIAAGFSASYAIKADGSLWSNGKGDFGQLGLGTTADVSTFTRIGMANDWKSVHTADLAGFYVLALKNNQSLWSWGQNPIGTLGLGNALANPLVPTQVGAALDWTHITAGGVTAYGLKPNQIIWGWGNWGTLIALDNTFLQNDAQYFTQPRQLSWVD